MSVSYNFTAARRGRRDPTYSRDECLGAVSPGLSIRKGTRKSWAPTLNSIFKTFIVLRVVLAAHKPSSSSSRALISRARMSFLVSMLREGGGWISSAKSSRTPVPLATLSCPSRMEILPWVRDQVEDQPHVV